MEIHTQQSDLIQSLLLESGRLMEDCAPELALQLPEDPVEARERVERLARIASALTALAAAAQVLLEPLPDRR